MDDAFDQKIMDAIMDACMRFSFNKINKGGKKIKKQKDLD